LFEIDLFQRTKLLRIRVLIFLQAQEVKIEKYEKIAFIGVSLWLVLFLNGCANRMAYDLATYVNSDILGISQLEIDALKQYAAVTGKNYTTDEAVRFALKDRVIPDYKRFFELLVKSHVETDEIKHLHKIYINGAQMLLNGFKTKMIGLEKNDVYLIRSGNMQIEKGHVETKKWRKELIALYEAYGVVQKK